MFDYFEPVPALIYRGATLSGWQGKDGPCALLVWRQGCRSPVSHSVDEEYRASTEKLASYRLKEGETEIYTASPDGGRWFLATIVVRDGLWIETKLQKQFDQEEEEEAEQIG